MCCCLQFPDTAYYTLIGYLKDRVGVTRHFRRDNFSVTRMGACMVVHNVVQKLHRGAARYVIHQQKEQRSGVGLDGHSV